MSYDLTFAKPKRKIAKKRVAELYAALLRGESNEAFEPLPVEDILHALCEAYEDFEPAVKFPMIEDNHGAAEVSHSTHRFTCCFRGETTDMPQRIADIFRRFGCPVYDPQVNVLYPLDQPLEGPAKVGLKDLLKLFEPKGEEAARVAEEVAALLERRKRKEREENREWYEPVEKLAAQIARDCAGGQWQRLGIDPESCAGALHNIGLHFQRANAHSPDDASLAAHSANLLGLDYTKADSVRKSLTLVYLGYLGAIPSGHEFSDVAAQARAGAARALEYFHGDWREGYRVFYYSEPMTREQTRAKLGWIEPYREGLLMALCVDDEPTIRRLIDWPDADLPVDDGAWNLTAGDNLAQIALACRLRGEPETKVTQVVKRLQASKRKRVSVFWSAAVAILENESREFAASLKQLCDLCWKQAPEKDRLLRPHVDGSILWHLARRTGIALPNLPERSLDRIVR
jgi:hypothetical protein